MNWFWNFLFYSFAGFLLELIYARAVRARKLDRKCRVFLPICPVYGLGAVAILALPGVIRAHPVLLYLGSALVCTAAEYGCSWFYEKAWHATFWDYSMFRGNLHGRVCLPFSAAWGVLGIVLVYWVHPLVARITGAVPDLLVLPTVLLYAVDFVLTGHLLRRGSTEALRWYRE